MKATLRPLVPALLIALAAGGCAAPRALGPLDPALASRISADCRRPFLKETRRLVHVLEAELPDGARGTGIGVLLADPGKGTFRTMLMTVEGWVLFDIEKDRKLTLRRAVPPFDAPGFARRMEEDIGLAFFPPGAGPPAVGLDGEGAPVCRFARPDGREVDVLNRADGAVEVRLYGQGDELQKSVLIPSFNRDGLAERIEIRRRLWPSYTLRLRLIEEDAGPPGGQ
ncbi:MAG: hypothetical protein AB1558_03510 [Thermodesulfobacteriota bacterium]